MNRSSFAASIAAALLVGCGSQAAPEPKESGISYRTRAENAPARIVKSYHLSETETVTVLVVPGFPFGERCIIYGDHRGNTMQCREISARQSTEP
jgi:hypothetical protein